MAALLTLRNALWLLCTSVELVLLICLLRRRLQATHAVFIGYIASTIAQSALAVAAYRYWGYKNEASLVIWSSQAVVISLRFAAAFETARRILSGYRGLWVLAKRLLWAVAVGAVGYSLVVAKKELSALVLNVDRGFELAIASFVVALLLFARYYKLSVHPLDRSLAIGFCLYSCFYVINDSLFERYLDSYLVLWGYLDILTFLASLLIWLHAVRENAKVTVSVPEHKDLPEGLYNTISPELNLRLKLLNDQVSQLLHAGRPRS